MAVGEEERPQAAAVGVEAVGDVPQPHEHLLHHLLRQCGVGQQPTGEREHGSGMAPVGLGERVLAPATDGHHEGGIAGRRQVEFAHLTSSSERAAGLDDGPPVGSTRGPAGPDRALRAPRRLRPIG